jgi:membrane-bound lytic murein transglycosylase MltF
MRPTTKFLWRYVAVAVLSAAVLDAVYAKPATPMTVVRQQNLMQADAKVVAQALLTKQQYKCFAQLIGKESAWNPKAKNPTSSAAGVGQLLSGTYKNLGMKHSSEAVPQMVASLAYIGRKYGSGGPCAAWAHWKAKKWY